MVGSELAVRRYTQPLNATPHTPALSRNLSPYRETSQDVDDDYTSRNVDLRSQATSRALMSEDDVAGKPNPRVIKFYNTTQESPIRM